MVVLIANPASRNGRARRLIPDAVRALEALGVDHRVVVTEDGSHPERAAREAAEQDADVVLAMGGDGQLSSCANGVLGSRTALAVLPAGNGNDLARTMGLDVKRPLSAVALVAGSRRRRIDAVRAEGPGWMRHFINVSGAGFDSETNEYANTLRRLKGTVRYTVAVFRTLLRFQPADFVVRVDGQELRKRAMMVAVANGPAYAGGMRVCPGASVDDGILDLCVVGAVPKRTFVAVFPRVFKGTHVTHPEVTMLRGAKVELDASRPFEVYGDGEHFGPLPVTFTVVREALEFVVP